MKSRFYFWKKHFMVLELIASLVIAAAFVYWSELLNGSTYLDDLLNGNRSEIYGSLAAIFGALLGFIITAVSIVLGHSFDDRLLILRESQSYPQLWEIFTVSIRALGIATIAALLGLIFDRDNNPVRIILYLNVFTFTYAVFRLARGIWILENVIDIVTKPQKTNEQSGQSEDK